MRAPNRSDRGGRQGRRLPRLACSRSYPSRGRGPGSRGDRQSGAGSHRSEERRVGEEGRSRWVPDYLKKKKQHKQLPALSYNEVYNPPIVHIVAIVLSTSPSHLSPPPHCDVDVSLPHDALVLAAHPMSYL